VKLKSGRDGKRTQGRIVRTEVAGPAPRDYAGPEMSIRLDRRVLLTIAVLIGGLWLSAPGTARAQADDDYWTAQLRYAGEFAGFRLASATGYERRLEVSSQQTPSPDIVFVSPGGIEPPPIGAPCIVQGADTVRCPIMNLQSVQIQFGAGNDRLDTVRYSSPSTAGFDIGFRMGQGNDRYAGGPLDEDWFGGPGNDFAKTGAGKDRLIGQAGDDRMFGGAGIDFFSGGKGNDFARGGGGDDKGSGGPGKDDFRD
jgi:RTX calcium-binding nonapeptide repeat (4 copies)